MTDNQLTGRCERFDVKQKIAHLCRSAPIGVAMPAVVGEEQREVILCAHEKSSMIEDLILLRPKELSIAYKNGLFIVDGKICVVLLIVSISNVISYNFWWDPYVNSIEAQELVEKQDKIKIVLVGDSGNVEGVLNSANAFKNFFTEIDDLVCKFPEWQHYDFMDAVEYLLSIWTPEELSVLISLPPQTLKVLYDLDNDEDIILIT